MISKRILFYSLFSIFYSLFFSGCSSSKKAAVNPPAQLYEVLKDRDGSKMLEGIVTKEQITQDTAFHWYAANVNLVKPDAAAVSAIAAKASKINIVIFGGTWCDDTHQLLPKYLSLLQAANFPDDHLTLIAVDRKKQTLGGFNNVFHITNVPTCIVMKDGKEIGRIVEYGKNGFVDKELGEMVSGVE
jgi:thiol-disulfide isomerase/thioredoxin